MELFDVETDEAKLLFDFDRFEPVDYGCGVFPLVEVVFFRDCAVDAVEDVDLMLVQIYRKQTTIQLHLFRHRRVLSIHQPRPPKQSTGLRLQL